MESKLDETLANCSLNTVFQLQPSLLNWLANKSKWAVTWPSSSPWIQVMLDVLTSLITWRSCSEAWLWLHLTGNSLHRSCCTRKDSELQRNWLPRLYPSSSEWWCWIRRLKSHFSLIKKIISTVFFIKQATGESILKRNSASFLLLRPKDSYCLIFHQEVCLFLKWPHVFKNSNSTFWERD